jgi:hypothetical protein
MPTDEKTYSLAKSMWEGKNPDPLNTTQGNNPSLDFNEWVKKYQSA